MTIYGQLLSRGYFPKELPPAFFTEEFADYARSKSGRALLESYKPSTGATQPAVYRLALSGHDGLAIRPLTVPHPWAFAALARLTSKHFRRLLRKAGASRFSKSRPVYAEGHSRAIRTLFAPPNLARERMNTRAGARYVLKVDVSQFYPSLYTHAVGWAIDPKLRQKKHWHDSALLGKQIDQLLMNLQGKVSQGIPIGNDISFLLAELVLSQIDKQLKANHLRSFRWFDDYEIACSSSSEAEETLHRLTRILDAFQLRLNPHKTKIVALPCPAGDGWQDELRTVSKTSFLSAANMVAHFDQAFRLRALFPDAPILMYAIGTLFRVKPPKPEVHRVAQSCITQAVLAEPGCAQKAFALLTFWELNGAAFDRTIVADTVDQLVRLHQYRGVSSDVTWALAFCIEHKLKLSRSTAKGLSLVDDDSVAIQALHARALGLAPGFSIGHLQERLRSESCDGSHWLVLYEAVRHGFMPRLTRVVRANPLFSDLLDKRVSFYRQELPPYATLLHQGGAPEWVLKAWLDMPAREATKGVGDQAIAHMIDADLGGLDPEGKTVTDLARELIDRLTEHPSFAWEPYA